MKGRKINICTYLGAVASTPLYLFIVAAHLFFTPGFQNELNIGANSSVKKETQSIYYPIGNDRSTYSENKHVKVTPKGQSHNLVPALAFSRVVPKTVTPKKRPYQPLLIHRHAYLLNRSFRI
jgi:hypothetical protein